jgi:hypothetical protein
MATTYEFTEASETWLVTHGLATRAPIVDTFVDLGEGFEKMLPYSVKPVDLMTVEIKWSRPRTGQVRVA